MLRSESNSADEQRRRQALAFMRGIMDEFTHLKVSSILHVGAGRRHKPHHSLLQNYALPVDPTLCLALAAENDAYQPREGMQPISEVWRGARIRYLRGEGHISSFIFKQ